MGRYIARRLLLFIPVVIGVYMLVFFSVRIVPGDTIDAQIASNGLNASGQFDAETLAGLRAEIGLDKPAWAQFFISGGKALKGDLGNSFEFRSESVVSRIRNALPVTLELAILSVSIGVLIALPFGVLAAVKQDTWIDHGIRLFAISGISVPEFVLGTILVVMPALWWNWFPYARYTAFFDDPILNLQIMILPAIALGMRLSATTMRMVRSSMLEVLRSDYVRTAWAKGLTSRAVLFRHALKNAMIAPITVIGTQIGFVIGGTVIIELIFNMPGLGRLTVDAIQKRDYAQIQGNVLFFTMAIIIINLVIDLSYSYFDPRIRYS